MRCKHCDATVPDSKDATLSAARWGWTFVADDSFHRDGSGLIPSAYYACPDHSDSDHADAWGFLRTTNGQ